MAPCAHRQRDRSTGGRPGSARGDTGPIVHDSSADGILACAIGIVWFLERKQAADEIVITERALQDILQRSREAHSPKDSTGDHSCGSEISAFGRGRLETVE